jgi:hypothetical protein
MTQVSDLPTVELAPDPRGVQFVYRSEHSVCATKGIHTMPAGQEMTRSKSIDIYVALNPKATLI